MNRTPDPLASPDRSTAPAPLPPDPPLDHARQSSTHRSRPRDTPPQPDILPRAQQFIASPNPGLTHGGGHIPQGPRDAGPDARAGTARRSPAGVFRSQAAGGNVTSSGNGRAERGTRDPPDGLDRAAGTAARTGITSGCNSRVTDRRPRTRTPPAEPGEARRHYNPRPSGPKTPRPETWTVDRTC